MKNVGDVLISRVAIFKLFCDVAGHEYIGILLLYVSVIIKI